MKKYLFGIYLLLFIVFKINGQNCSNFVTSFQDSYEFEGLIPGIVPGSTYHPQAYLNPGFEYSGDRFLYMNIVDGYTGIVYSRNMDVCPGNEFRISFWIRQFDNNPGSNFNINIYDGANNTAPLLSTQNIVNNGTVYNQIVLPILVSSGSNITFELVTVAPGGNGNDICFDDLLLETCEVIPTFTQVAPICLGESLSPLPTTSNNGITGTWSPDINASNTTTYTFTPTPISSNLIINGDFSLGNSGFSTDYQFLDNAGLFGVQKAYGINTSATNWFQFFPPCTSLGTPSGGNMMIVDGSISSTANDMVWGQNITVLPNQSYTFSFWVQALGTTNLAELEVMINGVSLGVTFAPNVDCEWNQVIYTWNSGTNTTANISLFDRSILQNGNDFSLDDLVFSSNTSQCGGPITMTIQVNEVLTPSFAQVAPICFDATSAALPTTSINNVTGTWSPALNNQATTTYSFTPSAEACATTAEMTITVDSAIIIQLLTMDTLYLGADYAIEATTTPSQGVQYLWSPADNLLCNNCLNPTASPTQNTTYTLSVTTALGCSASANISLVVLQDCEVLIPNAFSPNGDGRNDSFVPIGSSECVQEVAMFRIYNRWGGLVFEKKNFPIDSTSAGWDGKLRNSDTPTEVYVYYIEVLYVDGGTEFFQGDVTLLR